MSKNNLCNNCGKQGHQFHQCKLPITSYGIILFRSSEKGIQYLMIRRKNSFGFIDFMRGKYIYNNVEHLQIMVDEMSVLEKEQIKLHDFNTLWRSMWGIKEAETDPVETNDNTSKNIQYKSEEIASQKKFDNLKAGIQLGENTELINLGNLIDNSSTKWKETEWEFPKGRRNYQERDLDCALREFEEETGLSKHNIKIIENIMPFEEIFLGSNHKSYKHKYFLAYTDIETDELDKYQETEVSKLDWKTLDECLESIRPYNLEKKQLIININKVLEEYRLY
jgi:ADP-ribose pyrophosphatase YjhB (NUDIX family)